MPSDTSPEIEAIQVARWRAMTPAERLAAADEMTQLVDALARADVRRSQPDASEREIDHALACRWYGADLADAAFSAR